MTNEHLEENSTTGGLPVSPTLGPTLDREKIETSSGHLGGRDVLICLLAVFIGFLAFGACVVLTSLIGFITNLSFFGRISIHESLPEHHGLGFFVVLIPVAGALLIGLMARYGSKGIQGHGIPEAMEQVLLNESRIPVRLTFLKPFSAAISIGTGGPFGAEGPIIATGGAVGSLLGQLLKTTASERRTLLAAGAAAGLSAAFASPIAAVLLAVELLLFEYRSRSIIPVALASVAAYRFRAMVWGGGPVFPMEHVLLGNDAFPLALYVLLGGVVGVFSVFLTRLVHAVEDFFHRLPVPWVFHPALGALAVGLAGLVDPRVFGVGYAYIEGILDGSLAGKTLLILGLLKFLSWTIYVGSGTSGGTLAPMFIMGGALGAALGQAAEHFLPGLGFDHRLAALVGMAAIFTGASRAFLASVILTFEMTHEPSTLIPVFGGCVLAYLVSCLMMPSTIMTEKLKRKGLVLPEGYSADFLAGRQVKENAVYDVACLQAGDSVEKVTAWLKSLQKGTSHQGFPVVDAEGRLVGVLTRRDLFAPGARPGTPVGELVKRPPVFVYEDDSVRTAVDLMAVSRVGRLPVVSRRTGRVAAIFSRSDLLEAYSKMLAQSSRARRTLRWMPEKKPKAAG